MCAAPVRTLAHWASLTVYTTSLIPGEKPKLSEVKEQRLTSFSIHILIFLCLQAKSLLRVIPVPVLFGVFLYFGIVSLSGTQLFERIGFIFVPFKYCPNLPHAVGVCLSLLITVLLILNLPKPYISILFEDTTVQTKHIHDCSNHRRGSFTRIQVVREHFVPLSDRFSSPCAF